MTPELLLYHETSSKIVNLLHEAVCFVLFVSDVF
jgi:hypothetical protein